MLELDGGKEVQAAYGRDDSLLTIRTGEGTKTYITDGHGDVRYLMDEEGNITDSYQGNAYDPGSLHRYTYVQNNPQMYNDPSGHFIGTIGMCVNSACHSSLNNFHTLNVIGMMSGVMNATVNQLLGGDDDLMGAYIKGYIAGFGFGAVYCGACAIMAICELTALVHMGMFALFSGISINELTLALCAGAVGNNKAALVHTVLTVLSIGGAMYELSLTGVISVTGPKGTVEVDIKGKANKGGSKTDFYVTPSGDAIPADKGQFEHNLSLMDNVDGKYVGETLGGPVRIEGPHPLDENFNGDWGSDHFIDHIHIEHRKNGLTGPWGKGWNNKTTIPLNWIDGDD